jgi:hypothetical protein
MGHHCMLKKTHIIFYIQQASHKWIEGHEKEIVYAQAIESLKVVLIDIEHGPKVLQRFKATHKRLVKALFSFENMENQIMLVVKDRKKTTFYGSNKLCE